MKKEVRTVIYDDGTFAYRGLNISQEVMLNLTEEVTCYLRPLHEMIMKDFDDLGREENLLLLISLLIQRYGQSFERCIPECRDEIEKVCRFMEQHFSEHIYLDQICHLAGLSKSTLLRQDFAGSACIIFWKISCLLIQWLQMWE